MQELAKILPLAFQQHVGGREAHLVKFLGALWKRVVGPGLAEQTRPARLESGVLTLETPCPTWAAQLRPMAGEIQLAVNDFLGGPAVRAVRIEHRALPGDPPRPGQRAPSAATHFARRAH